MGYFKGWYFKHQKDSMTLSVIPGHSSEGSFIQVILNESAMGKESKIKDLRPWNIGSASYFISGDEPIFEKRTREGPLIRIDRNYFSPKGITLNIQKEDLHLIGSLRYVNLTPVKGDVMGFFRYLPMECHHSIVSMNHNIYGRLCLNGDIIDFNGGLGYIEGDRGRSFPNSYIWVQYNEKDTSVMVSIAEVPIAGTRFWGCLCVLVHGGKEYRLATYKGVKINVKTEHFIELVQGDYRLLVEIIDGTEIIRALGRPLHAPRHGKMCRIIRENPSCKVRFRFSINEKVIFDKIGSYASYEYV